MSVPVPADWTTALLQTIAKGLAMVTLYPCMSDYDFPFTRSHPWPPIRVFMVASRLCTILTHDFISYYSPSSLILWLDSLPRAFALTIPTFWSITLQDTRTGPHTLWSLYKDVTTVSPQRPSLVNVEIPESQIPLTSLPALFSSTVIFKCVWFAVLPPIYQSLAHSGHSINAYWMNKWLNECTNNHE